MAAPSVCVFCGSRMGVSPAFERAASAFGAGLAEQGWQLVYGAGDVGLMGTVARAVQSAGGETFGVIPEWLIGREIGKTDLTHYVITETMHERKKVMFMNSDALVVLPGGAGSLDEFFEVLTWAQMGMHDKPIFLLNTEGYWAPLLALLEHVVAHGFAGDGLLGLATVCDTPQALIGKLRAAFSRRQAEAE